MFCPYHSDAEWARLKAEDRAGWDRAVEIDRLIRSPESVCTRRLRQLLFLHRSCQPLDRVSFAGEPARGVHPMTAGECDGMCEV